VDIAAAMAALLLAAEAPAGGMQAETAAACQGYTRNSADAPELVRWWLAHSHDERVRVCTAPGEAAAASAALQYSGESAVGRSGGVCSYASHFLTASGTGPTRRLQRYERTEAVAMVAVGEAACPPAHDPARGRYIPTYDLTPATFESLLAFWAAAAASADVFAHDLACCGGGAGGSGGAGGGAGAEAPSAGSVASSATQLRLRATIAAGRMQAAAVTRIVRVAAHGLHRRYALFVADPDSRPPGASVYVIYVTRLLRGPWHISGISDVAP